MGLMPNNLQVPMKEYNMALLCASSCEPQNMKYFLPNLCKALHKLGYA